MKVVFLLIFKGMPVMQVCETAEGARVRRAFPVWPRAAIVSCKAAKEDKIAKTTICLFYGRVHEPLPILMLNLSLMH